MKKILFAGLFMVFCTQSHLSAHCQMPCGIYHDEMVFDQIDQYVETMAKGITILMDSKFTTLQEHNEFVRWVMQKEKMSDETAHLFLTYFLQQKIKPGEEDTPKRVQSAHQLLFLLVQLKQTADLKILNDFYEEWENFKLMFHIEGYKCRVGHMKMKKEEERRREIEEKQNKRTDGEVRESEKSKYYFQAVHAHDHDHDHTHDHDHNDLNHTH